MFQASSCRKTVFEFEYFNEFIGWKLIADGFFITTVVEAQVKIACPSGELLREGVILIGSPFFSNSDHPGPVGARVV
ncbi:hypothetical protein D3C72_1676990 [compost metagenome]